MEDPPPPPARTPVVLLPPRPPPGLPADAAEALVLGVVLDAVDALAGPAIDLRVAVGDPAAEPLLAALLPPGASTLPLAGEDREAALRAVAADVVRLEAPPPAEIAAALDRAGPPSPSPRAWHLAHRLPELAHSD